MALVIEARLLQGRYEAALSRGDRAEWPPHPARIFCALVSVARSEGEREALRWLERQPPPQVRAPELAEESAVSNYVVTNKTSSKGGSQQWPGRTSVERLRASATSADDAFALVWPDAQADAAMVEALADLAWKVPYLGRSSSPAALRVHTSPKDRQDWQTWDPVRLGTIGALGLRVPYPGYLEALDGAFEQGRRAFEVARTADYLLADSEAPSPPAGVVCGPFSRLLAFSFPARTVRPHASEVLRLTGTLRKAVMSVIGQDIAPQISGHNAPDRAHVGFVALPNAGHAKADGHLVGMGLLVPAELDERASAQLQAVLEVGPLKLYWGRGGEVVLEHEPWPSRPRRLRPDYWTGPQHGASEWATATPMALDRHPRRTDSLADLVAHSFVKAGYPAPGRVRISQSPLIEGALHRPAAGTYPPKYQRRKLVHAHVVFDEPLHGPVVAGALRYRGLGLFAPIPTEKEERQ